MSRREKEFRPATQSAVDELLSHLRETLRQKKKEKATRGRIQQMGVYSGTISKFIRGHGNPSGPNVVGTMLWLRSLGWDANAWLDTARADSAAPAQAATSRDEPAVRSHSGSDAAHLLSSVGVPNFQSRYLAFQQLARDKDAFQQWASSLPEVFFSVAPLLARNMEPEKAWDQETLFLLNTLAIDMWSVPLSLRYPDVELSPGLEAWERLALSHLDLHGLANSLISGYRTLAEMVEPHQVHVLQQIEARLLRVLVLEEIDWLSRFHAIQGLGIVQRTTDLGLGPSTLKTLDRLAARNSDIPPIVDLARQLVSPRRVTAAAPTPIPLVGRRTAARTH